jgi:hypothetical protein
LASAPHAAVDSELWHSCKAGHKRRSITAREGSGLPVTADIRGLSSVIGSGPVISGKILRPRVLGTSRQSLDSINSCKYPLLTPPRSFFGLFLSNVRCDGSTLAALSLYALGYAIVPAIELIERQ